jgi:hypothetical protein
MAIYRAFLIDEHGHCVGVKVLDGCETDEDAMVVAKQCVDECAVEVWKAIGRLAAEEKL